MKKGERGTWGHIVEYDGQQDLWENMYSEPAKVVTDLLATIDDLANYESRSSLLLDFLEDEIERYEGDRLSSEGEEDESEGEDKEGESLSEYLELCQGKGKGRGGEEETRPEKDIQRTPANSRETNRQRTKRRIPSLEVMLPSSRNPTIPGEEDQTTDGERYKAKPGEWQDWSERQKSYSWHQSRDVAPEEQWHSKSHWQEYSRRRAQNSGWVDYSSNKDGKWYVEGFEGAPISEENRPFSAFGHSTSNGRGTPARARGPHIISPKPPIPQNSRWQKAQEEREKQARVRGQHTASPKRPVPSNCQPQKAGGKPAIALEEADPAVRRIETDHGQIRTSLHQVWKPPVRI